MHLYILLTSCRRTSFLYNIYLFLFPFFLANCYLFIFLSRSHILIPCKLEVNFDETSTLLDIPTILTLNHTLPPILRHRWRLLFSTRTHGESFQSLLHQITHQGPTLVVAKDQGGHVFGGFASKSWTIKSQFDGTDFDCLMHLII